MSHGENPCAPVRARSPRRPAADLPSRGTVGAEAGGPTLDVPAHRRAEVGRAVVERLGRLLEDLRVEQVRAATRLEFTDHDEVGAGGSLWVDRTVAEVLTGEVERLIDAWSATGS